MTETKKFECGSLFSGCGGADVGMQSAGFTPLFAVEYDTAIADIYRANHDSEVIGRNILEVEFIPAVDLLWVSPPCPSFSIANQNKGETETDKLLANHIAKLIVGSQPGAVIIENVSGYLNSESYLIITAALNSAGYKIDSAVYNAANFGVPQTRKRLIIRASKNRLPLVIETHAQDASQMSLFQQVKPWVSWYDAIDGLTDSLKESKLTEKQISAIKSSAHIPLLISGIPNKYQSSFTIRAIDSPAPTITASIEKHPTRLLIERNGYRGGQPKAKQANEPAPTIRSHVSYDGKGNYRTAYNIIDAKCLAAGIECLAAWQSFPRDFKWGNNRSTAAKAIGNAVPPLLAKAIATTVIFSSIGAA